MSCISSILKQDNDDMEFILCPYDPQTVSSSSIISQVSEQDNDDRCIQFLKK